MLVLEISCSTSLLTASRAPPPFFFKKKEKEIIYLYLANIFFH